MFLKEKFKNPMVGNFISLVLLQGVNYVLPLLSYPFLFRVLGVERWGLISFGYALIQYFIMFTDFGFNLSATKYISENRNDIQKINTYLNSAMIGRIILGIISLFILILLIYCFDLFQKEALFYLLYFGMVIGNIMFPMWFFQGMETMKYITIFNLAAKLLTFMPLFIFIKGPDDYIYVPIWYGIGFIIAGFISLYIIYKKLKMKWYIPPYNHIKKALSDSSTYFLSRASTSLFTTSNTFILGLVCGNIAVGYYSSAEKLYQAYNQMLSPLIGVLYPHVAKTHDTIFFKRIFKYITSANVFILISVLLCSQFIITIVYGNADEMSVNVFRILLTACLVTIPSMLLGYPFLAAMGHPLYTNWTTVTTSLVHMIGLLILFLTQSLTIYTVAGMVVISECLLITFRIRGVIKFKLMRNNG